MLFQTCASIFAVCSSGCPGTGWCRSWSWPTWGPQLQMRWDQTLFANYVSAYCKVPNRIYRIFWGVFWHFLARQITYSVQNLWGQFWPWPIWGPLFATYFSYYVLLKKLHWNRIDLVYFWRFFDIFWPDKSLTLCGISEANFGLDQLEDLICSCAGIKLYGVELAIHEVESSIDGPSVDRTQDLLFGGWPLSSPCSKCLVKTLKVRIQYAV